MLFSGNGVDCRVECLGFKHDQGHGDKITAQSPLFPCMVVYGVVSFGKKIKKLKKYSFVFIFEESRRQR